MASAFGSPSTITKVKVMMMLTLLTMALLMTQPVFLSFRSFNGCSCYLYVSCMYHVSCTYHVSLYMYRTKLFFSVGKQKDAALEREAHRYEERQIDGQKDRRVNEL